MGRRVFPNPLTAAGVNLEVFLDHFPSGTPDVDWIPPAAQHGWIVLTNDVRLRYNPSEREAIAGSNGAIIILASDYTHQQLAENFLAARELIIDFVRSNRPPFIARLYRGRIEMWLSRDDLTH